ncbi:hypothetical protein IWX81_002279 [Salinibacterium sp. CAN_S4]|uniref:DUF6345 domain-containing protein n=1 Tax=Salinibacterium sp. CAN_S4 TaxID=2787727 RepID=UPI0018EF859F
MPVVIDPEIIRPYDGRLSVLALGERSDAGAERVFEVARSASPDAEFRDLADGIRGGYVDDRLVAYVDSTSGDSRTFPRLDLLDAARGLDRLARRSARELMDDDGLFPADDTARNVLDPQILHGSRGTVRRVSETSDFLAISRIQRVVDGIPVVGEGSQSTVTVSGAGLEGITHNWRAARVTDELSGADIDARRVAESITDSLAPAAQRRDIRVESVELVYYDGDNELIQPAFRYRAIFDQDDRLPAARLTGFVPAIDAVDRFPIAIPTPTREPRVPKAFTTGLRSSLRPIIGRYVVRADNAGWVTSANSFLAGLRSATPSTGISPIDRQYFWAEPRLFTSENRDFVDAVQVALTEVHGDWSLFSTLRNNADFVDLADVPADGYGGASGVGSLAYWILHSCAVIPTSFDSTTSYDPWWKIFNGMRAALGYRTEMWINDEITYTFGRFAGLGAPMVSNWLSTVITDDSYTPVSTYLEDRHHTPGVTQPMGRPSAVTVLGHADDTIFQVSALPRPSVLQQWWYGN